MTQQNSLNIRQKLTVVLADVLVLAEMFYALSVATKAPDELTPLFFRTFLPMVVPTIVGAFVALRVLRDRPEQARS